MPRPSIVGGSTEGVTMPARGVLTGVVLLALTAGCAGASAAPAAVPAPSATQWREPAAYTYVLTAGCTRGFSGARFQIVVRQGKVVSAAGLEPQASSHPDYAVPTLGELERLAVRARAANPGFTLERDPADGHPTAVGFDPDAMAVDAGECFAVSGYQPL
jgi:hypothetical protein